MAYRSTADRGNTDIPANAAILGYRLVPEMPVADALEVFSIAEEQNEWAAAVRRHPSWSPDLENDYRFQPDTEWSTPELRFARDVLLRALRVYGPQDITGLTRLRTDGRREVADHGDARELFCPLDDWCILDTGHPGACNEEREVWAGGDVLYPVSALEHA